MKIYDCFTFFNELDLLELRLSELDKSVDYFVIVEATKTFSGEKKELVFEKNKERFSKWKDKIIYISTDLPNLNFLDREIIKLMDSKKLPKFGTNSLGLNFLAVNLRIGRWKFVYAQRDRILKGLKDAKEEDIIIFSDLDEIPNKDKFDLIVKKLKIYDYVYFKQKLCFYYLNGVAKNQEWVGTISCKYRTLRDNLFGKLSYIRNPSIFESICSLFGKKRKISFIEGGGWHFTYLGGIKKALLKSKSVAEAKDIDFTENLLKKNIEKGLFQLGKRDFIKIDYVPLDNSFPETIRKNKKKYEHLVKKI